MNKLNRILAGIGLVLALGTAPAPGAEDPLHAYIGVQKCKMCHNSKSKGAQFTQWTASAHSRAYETLATARAREIASARQLSDPLKSLQCLRCHITGHDAPAARLTATYRVEDGVGCESCHGPGGDYWKISIMKDRNASIAAGLVIPDETTCVSCHNDESPTFKGFDFAAMLKKIAHPNPLAATSR